MIIGIAGILAMFFLGKEAKDERVGWIAALITCFSFIHILFSQEVRFYSLLFFSSAASYLFFIRAIKGRRVLDFSMYIVSTILLLYTHYFGLVVFATQGILFLVILFLRPLDKKFIILSLCSALLISVAIIPWIPIFVSDAKTETFWIQPEPWYFPFKYFYVYFKDIISCIAYAIALILYGTSLYKKFLDRHSLDPTDIVLVGSVVGSFLIPIVYSLIQTPMLQVRYSLIALPSIIVMISLGMALLKGNYQLVALPFICCAAFFSLVVIERHYVKINKEDWRGIVTAVINERDTAATFVSLKAWYCNYYFRSLGSPIRAILPDQFKAMVSTPRDVWWMEGFDIAPGPSIEEIDFTNAGFIRLKVDSAFRTRAIHYRLVE